jgi:hypothetical protein
MTDLERDGPDKTGYVTLREYIERIFEEHRDAHAAQHVTGERALSQAREVIEHRLEAMNKFREDVEKDRNEFLRVETFNVQMSNVTKQIRVLEDTVKDHTPLKGAIGRIEILEKFKDRSTTIGTIIVVLSGGLGFVLSKLFPT